MKVSVAAGLCREVVEAEVSDVVQEPQQEKLEVQEQCSLGLPHHKVVKVRPLVH